MTYCEDYPCCGHTPLDPCAPQWYDAPDAFDLTRNPHAFCEHEYGMCDVDEDGEAPCEFDQSLCDGADLDRTDDGAECSWCGRAWPWPFDDEADYPAL